MIKRLIEDWAWRRLIKAAYRWSTKHMDQWEKVKFHTPYGVVYLTLSLYEEHRESFNPVNSDGSSGLSEAQWRKLSKDVTLSCERTLP